VGRSWYAIPNLTPTHFNCIHQESGSPIGSPSPAVLQCHYNALVAANDCSADTETLSCLRRVPFDSLMAMVNRTADIFSYQSLALVWQPYVDGDVVARDPLVSVTEGLYAKVSPHYASTARRMTETDPTYDRRLRRRGNVCGNTHCVPRDRRPNLA
jgi:hypothetical protein